MIHWRTDASEWGGFRTRYRVRTRGGPLAGRPHVDARKGPGKSPRGATFRTYGADSPGRNVYFPFVTQGQGRGGRPGLPMDVLRR